MTNSAEWREAVEALLVKDYGITVDDVGLDDHEIHAFFNAYPNPDEFVDWFARKYDLTSGREIGLQQ